MTFHSAAGGHGRQRSAHAAIRAAIGRRSKRPHSPTRSVLFPSGIPERDDQIAHRRKKRGRPIDFGDRQRECYKGRNVVERCFNKLKQWRGIAMRSDELARNYHAARCLAATLHWLRSVDVAPSLDATR